ncbi:MAG: hypothetical protein R3332_10500 [Pseudohongiellaceae bacterium]|nr:hypothetical protein [Pseudohongiellaceae bacterium]
MKTFTPVFKTLMTAALSASMLLGATLVAAQGNSGNSNAGGNGNGNGGHSNAGGNGNGNGNGNGGNNNIGNGNASNGVKALISTGKGIVYTGEPLDISIRFPRGSDLVSAGEVDASVIIFTPDDSAAAIVVPVSNVASETETKLFELAEVDVSTLPAGHYQLGLVLTNPGGDPLNMNDWYDGLLGLIEIKGLTISDEALPEDADGDGIIDDDVDGDGFIDEEEIEEEESEEEEAEEETEEEETEEEAVEEEETEEAA